MATASPSSPPVLNNLPNQLTAARLVLAVALFVFIAVGMWLWCLVVFAAAAVTDWLDGYLARKQGLTSAFGRNFDPLVDKVLVCGAYIFLLPYGLAEAWLLPWMVTVIVARELVITGLRSFLENQGATFGADWLGKLKMGLQCAALFGIFAFLQLQHSGAAEAVVGLVATVRDGLVYSMLAATALSGLQYLWRAALLLKAGAET
jgi:CDP-diacylglycerol--glycerol-3-phosphate 3-phosphatidyltransferase